MLPCDVGSCVTNHEDDVQVPMEDLSRRSLLALNDIKVENKHGEEVDSNQFRCLIPIVS